MGRLGHILTYPILIWRWRLFYYAKKKLKKKEGDCVDLDWRLSNGRRQNLPSSNPQDWVSSSSGGSGGLLTFPSSMAEDRVDEKWI